MNEPENILKDSISYWTEHSKADRGREPTTEELYRLITQQDAEFKAELKSIIEKLQDNE